MIVTLTVLLGMFCAAMEALITATLLPTIIAEFGHMELYPWIINGFLLLFILITPVFGKLSDTYGYKRIYLLAVFIFLFSSLLCGFSQSMSQLVFFRSLQGIGTGGLITMSVIFFGEVFSLDERPKMQALLSSMWAIASILGPSIGAYLALTLSWRWAFLINIPLASLIFLLILVFVENKTSEDSSASLDLKGMALFFPGCSTLVYGLVELSQFRVFPSALLFLSPGIFFLWKFYCHSKRENDSFLPLNLFVRKEALLAVVMVFFGGIFLFATANFMPLYVQGVLGESAKQSSYVITAIALGSFTGAIFSGIFLNRSGFRKMTSGGSLAIIMGYGMTLTRTAREKLILLGLCSYTIGMGISMIANSSIIALQASSPKEMLGRATSMFHFFRSFGGLIGVSVLGGLQVGIFKWGIEDSQMADAPELLFNPALKNTIANNFPLLKSALSQSLLAIYGCCFIIGLIAWTVSLNVTTKRPIDYKETPHV